jgi:phospholipid transport system substrate-binding protein
VSAIVSRRVFVAAAAAAALMPATGSWATAESDDPAGAFIRELGDRAVRILFEKENTSFEQREAAFREIMVEGFDIATISRFVLGRHWKTASEQQRSDYSTVFVDFIVRVYASRFDAYNGEKFEIGSVLDEADGDKIVRARILRPSGGEPIGVDFRVRSMDERYRVVDVNVEGISMLHTHRVEFASVINRKGIDGLLTDLRSRIEAPVDTAVN